MTYFNDKNHKSEQKYKKYKMLTTIIKSIATIVIFGATSSSLRWSLTGIGLIVIPVSTGVASGLTICNKVLHEIICKSLIKTKNNTEQIDKLLIFHI